MIVRWPLTSIKRSEECRSNVRITDFFCFHIVTHIGARAGTGTSTDTASSSGTTGTGLIWTRSARMEETSRNQIKSIKLYSKLISIEFPGMNQVDRHFEDLEDLNTINIQYSEILSNVTTRGSQKLYSTEVIDVRFGRSTNQIITNQFIITSHCQ